MIKVWLRWLPVVPLHRQQHRTLPQHLFECFVAVHIKTGVMYEYILASFVTDEAVTFLVVEPLNSTFAHDVTSKNIKDVFCRSLSATELRIA